MVSIFNALNAKISFYVRMGFGLVFKHPPSLFHFLPEANKFRFSLNLMCKKAINFIAF